MPAGILVDRPSLAVPTQQHLRSTHEATGINNEMRYCANASVFGDASMKPDKQSSSPTQFTLDRVKLAAVAELAVRSGDSPIAGFNGLAVSAASANPPTSSSAMAVYHEHAVNGLASSSVFGSPGAAAVTTILSTVGGRRSVNMTECVPVPSSEHVAEIVGRQGSKIKALRAKTNTYIKTPVRGEEPVFVVTGRCEDVAAAKREILSSSEHFSQIRASRFGAGIFSGLVETGFSMPSNQSASVGDGSKQITIQVRVPYQVVGLVVGPKGATIKRIQQDSSTYIVTPSREREPVFEVTGTPEGVEKARLDIERYIAIRTRTAGTTDASEFEVLAPSVPQPMVGSPTDEEPGNLPDLLDSKTQFKTILKTGLVACDDTSLSSSYNGIYNMNSPVSLHSSSNDSINRCRMNQVPVPESVGQSKLCHTNRDRIPLRNVHPAGVHLSTNASISSSQANLIQYNTAINVANDLVLPVCDILSSSTGSIDLTSKLQNLTSLVPMVNELSLDDWIGKLSLPGSDECANSGSLNAILASLIFSTDSSPATTLHDNSINSYQNQQFSSASQWIHNFVEPSLFSANQMESVRCVPRSNAICDQLSLCQ